MIPERVSYQSVFQQIAQERPPSGERRSHPVRRDHEPSVAATALVPAALSPQEQEERQLEERRPTRPRRAVNPRRTGKGSDRPPSWAFDSWPFPFTSFWTGLAAMSAFSWTGSLVIILVALGVGIWAGVALEHWLRRHRSSVRPWVRTLLGADRPEDVTPAARPPARDRHFPLTPGGRP